MIGLVYRGQVSRMMKKYVWRDFPFRLSVASLIILTICKVKHEKSN